MNSGYDNNVCLKIEEAAVGYGRRIVLDNINLTLTPGEIVSVIGPNGSGKSTLLKSIINELNLIKGVITLGDKDINAIDRREMARNISVLMTDRIKTELTTCYDVVALARYPYTGRMGLLTDKDRQVIDDAMKLVNASELTDVDFSCISDGQRQRIMLARCIAQEPSLIILDEPTTFLDIKYKIEILQILRRLSHEKNITVLMSLHEIDFARYISDKVICVKNGQVDSVGKPDEVLSDDYIRELYDISVNDYRSFFKKEDLVCRNRKLLRKGITTGTCAAAAARAAAVMLFTDIDSNSIAVDTPSGERVFVETHLEAENTESITYSVIKYSGDDPDITNGAKVFASLSYIDEVSEYYFESEEYEGLYLTGGDGIGRVTKEGLEQEIGYSAINRVPRKMIFEAVGEIYSQLECRRKLLCTISVENGEELASKTFNPMLGIEGGLSILGTSGILEPMSEKAIVDTIEVLIKQQASQQKEVLLVNPGLYGQRYLKEKLKIDVENSIKCSNFIGETIDMAALYGYKYMLLVGNLGKLVKLAAGIMNTHSGVADGRMEILITHMAMCGGTKEMASELYSCINTDAALDKLKEFGLYEEVIKSLIGAIESRVNRRAGDELKVGIIIFSEKYGLIGRTEYADEALENYKTVEMMRK